MPSNCCAMNCTSQYNKLKGMKLFRFQPILVDKMIGLERLNAKTG